MLPLMSALLPLIEQSHDELHLPDQKLERLSLKPERPMQTPDAVEYAPAAPALASIAGVRGLMDARTTCDEANELEKSGKASVRSRTHRFANWPQRTAGKPLARFGALAPFAQAPLRPPARACCEQRQQHGRTCCMGMRARIRWHNMVICSSKVVVHESAGAAGALEGLRRLRVKEVAVA